MGDSGSAQEVGTFSSRADDFHTREILPVVNPRDCPATWSASVYSVGERSQNYGTLLEEFSEGHGDIVDYKHCISSSNRWSVGDNHTDFRGHVASMRRGS